MARLRIDAVHITAFPDDAIGQKALSFIEELDLDTSFIKISDDRRGLYF